MDKFSELKAAALAATPGPWESVYDDWSDGDGALISCESRYGMVAIAKIEGGGEASGYDEPFSSEQQANAAFIAAANPAVVLTMLAELEAKEQLISEMEINFKTQLSVSLAELQQKLATPVQLPDPDENDYGYQSISYLQAIDAINEAGFIVEGDK